MNRAPKDSAPTDGEDLVEDIFVLSPLQQGMLLHLLRTPGQPDYLTQFSWRVHGCGTEVLHRAWKRLAERHPVLRTGVLWEGLSEPVQVIYRFAELPTRIQDLSGLDEAGRDKIIDDFRACDALDGFRPDDLPFARLAMFSLGDDEVHLVFTHHGFLLDGWSVTLLFGDLEALVQAELDGAAVPAWPGAPFRDYVARLQGRDRAAEESYWRAALGGVQAATPLPAIDRPAGDVAASGQVSLGLSTSESERIRSVLRRLGVTVGVYAQAAWAITLAGLTGVDDVVFGLVVSGRTVELPGVDRTVGHLTNTVPVRIGTRPGTAAGAWLREMTVRHAMTLANEHTALTEIHPLTEIPAGSPLVRSVLVVQNYPQSRAEEVRSVRISHAEAQESVPMPMTLFVVPGDAIDLRLSYRTELVSERTAEATLTAMRAALLGLTDEDGQVDAISVVPDGFRPPDPVLAGVAEPERQSPVAPRDPVEEMIATVWRDVLAREDIGVHDDFFALGGDSLMAIRVVGRIRELTTIEYPVAEFFDEPTIAAAAGSVGRMLADAADRLTDLVDEVELSHVDG